MSNRIIIRVQWHIGHNGWMVSKAGAGLDGMARTHWRVKRDAIADAAQVGREYWRNERRLAQLVIHKKDGTIQSERTYGKDPRRTKG